MTGEHLSIGLERFDEIIARGKLDETELDIASVLVADEANILDLQPARKEKISNVILLSVRREIAHKGCERRVVGDRSLLTLASIFTAVLTAVTTTSSVSTS